MLCHIAWILTAQRATLAGAALVGQLPVGEHPVGRHFDQAVDGRPADGIALHDQALFRAVIVVGCQHPICVQQCRGQAGGGDAGWAQVSDRGGQRSRSGAAAEVPDRTADHPATL